MRTENVQRPTSNVRSRSQNRPSAISGYSAFGVGRSAFSAALSAICILQSAICNLPAAPQPTFELKVNANGDIISSTLPSNHIVNFPTGTSLKINGVAVTAGSGLPTQTGHSGDLLTTNGTTASWLTRITNANLPLSAAMYDEAGTTALLILADAGDDASVNVRGVTFTKTTVDFGNKQIYFDKMFNSASSAEIAVDDLNGWRWHNEAETAWLDDLGFTGVGTLLTALNGSNISSGTVAFARLPTGTSSSTVAVGDHTHNGVYQPVDSGLGLVKPAVAVVAASNLTLSGEQTIDGQLTSSSLVLCTAQTTGANNGPWISGSGAWTRPTWYATGSTSQAPQFLTTFVRLGTTYTGSTWRMTTAAVTIGTTATTWVQTPISLASSNVTGTLPVANGGTGITSFGSGIATWLGTPTEANLKSAQSGLAWLDTAQTFTAAQTNSISGAASVPAMKYSGVPFAGTGTTSFPLLYLNDSTATASTTLSTSGTYLGVNGHGSANLLNLMVDGVNKFIVQSDGTTKLTTGGFEIATSSVAGAATRSVVVSNQVYLKSSGVLSWSSASTDVVPLDTGLSRNAAGVVEVNNGTAISGTSNTGKLKAGGATLLDSGTASVSPLLLSGVPFAGTGTTSFPLLYINDANATASTTLNTAGTYLGVNGDGTQDLMNLLQDGTSQLKVSSAGVTTIGGSNPTITSPSLLRIKSATSQPLILSVTSGNAVVSLNADNTITLGGGVTTDVQSLSGAGAVNLITASTAFTSTGGAQALTLANGAVGQIKTICHVVDGGSGVLTPTTKAGYSTITFTNAGDSVTLQYHTTAGWCIVGSYGVTIAP